MRVALALFAASTVLLAGCTSSNEGSPSPSPEPSAAQTTPEGGSATNAGASPSADPEVGPGKSTAEQLAADPATPSAFVTWGDTESPFVLVQCEAAGASSLSASGDDVAGGTLLTLNVSDGKGTLFITEDATLETTLNGAVDTFAAQGTAFNGSGTYQTKSGEARQFTFRGDCKDL